MNFFEPPPRPPEADEPDEEELEQPEWISPPGNVLGTPVPFRTVLARTDTVAVAVTNLVAFPAGFTFELIAKDRSPRDPYEYGGRYEDPLELHFPRRSSGGELPDELLRFGIEFSDGRKATTVGRDAFHFEPESTPEGPLLTPHGGGGGMGSWHWEFWAWPLPPPGPLAFVCEWPAHGISLTRHEIDAGVILQAAETVETLWDEPGPAGGGSSWVRLGG